MGAHMKTTVEISDALANAAKEAAKRDNTALRELIEAGLRRVLEERHRRQSFQLRDASFGDGGLQLEFRDAEWNRIRDAAYEGHGA